MKKAEPVILNDLFPPIHGQLIDLLKSLTPEQWHLPTVCKLWNVKDVVAHLLDTQLRRLSMHRDGYFAPGGADFQSKEELIAFLNRLNAEWVTATRRLSPRMLIELLDSTVTEIYTFFNDLDPYGKAFFPVAWAGEELSQNWFDVAREYTERWLHQQQIREAVGKPGIMTQQFYFPFLDIFMRALPYTYRDVEAPEGTLLKFTVSGEGGGSWFLQREHQQWILLREATAAADATARIDGAVAWKLFSKSITPQQAAPYSEFQGNREWAEKILYMVSVMA